MTIAPFNPGASKPVAEQYEQWVFPLPIDDLEAYCKTGKTDGPAPHVAHLMFWPDGGYINRYQEKLDILVAGCGANAAARYAYQHPKSRVVGIDLSANSLAHESYLKEKHNLTNLQLYQMRIEDLEQLGKDFDFIDCVGVLHHLPDPVAGLKSLKKVLRPDGVIGVMLYALYGRSGLYMLQDLFQRLSVSQSASDVAMVKETLAHLNPDHLGYPMFQSTWDISFDAGVVDMFLHPIDRAYTVEGCLDFAKAANMNFIGWTDPFFYHPEGLFPGNLGIIQRMNQLPKEQLWANMELLYGGIRMHSFHLCHPQRVNNYNVIDFDAGDAFLDYIPVQNITELNMVENNPNIICTIKRLYYTEIPLNLRQASLLDQCNGQNTIRQVIEQCGIQDSYDNIKNSARGFFKSADRLGYFLFQIPAKS